MHEFVDVNTSGAKVLVSDSMHATRTYLALSEDEQSVLVEVEGSEALIALAHVLLEQAHAVLLNEQAAAVIAAGQERFADA